MRKLTDNNRLSIKYPNLCDQWDYDKNGISVPSDFSYGSKKKAWWKCNVCKHSWLSTINNRVYGSGCPSCCGRILSRLTCLKYVNPKLSREWNYEKNGNLSPFDVFPNSVILVWWKCKRGHEWQALISNRNNLKQSCPYCTSKKVNDENCLLKINPKLSKSWSSKNKINPSQVFPNSNEKFWWKCEVCNNEWSATVNSRTCGTGCPYCCGQKVCDANSLGVLNPNLAKEWHPTKNLKWTAKHFTINSSKKVWWKCSVCGKSWQATIANRSACGTGCPRCQKITLFDGTECDSLIEAYFYLHFKEKGLSFVHHKKYNENDVDFKNFSCDFYFSESNTYMEITGYTDNNCPWWKEYFRKIRMKKKYAESLGAKFEFIQKQLTCKQKCYVISKILKQVK